MLLHQTKTAIKPEKSYIQFSSYESVQIRNILHLLLLVPFLPFLSFLFFPVFMFIIHVQYHNLKLFLVYHKTMNRYEYMCWSPLLGPMHFSELYGWSVAHALKEQPHPRSFSLTFVIFEGALLFQIKQPQNFCLLTPQLFCQSLDHILLFPPDMRNGVPIFNTA